VLSIRNGVSPEAPIQLTLSSGGKDMRLKERCIRARAVLSAGVIAVAFSSAASGGVLFSDPGESLSNFQLIQDSNSLDSTATVVDYSTLGIPEAPHQLALSAPTTGIQLTANKGDSTAAAAGINLVLGSTPVVFTGTHTLQFDIWMNAPAGATSTTEGMLGGTARAVASDAMTRNFRTSRGNSQGGAWFYASGDNGNATDDFAQLNAGARDVVFADTTDATSAAKYNSAFKDTLVTGGNNDADNEWVQVSIVQDGNTASVYMNGVLFSTDASTNSGGFAWLGYEDMFGSIGSSDLYGIVDNVSVVEGNAVPEPAGLSLLCLGGVAVAARRRRRHA
jgi:hypothetical protein